MEMGEHSKKPIRFLKIAGLYENPFMNLPVSFNFDQLTYFKTKNYSSKITQLKEDGRRILHYYSKNCLALEEFEY